tara:strand:+ start:1883 stop:3316 length:1434 start_codon:yes stop_codon:yes gene_type:complete
MAFSIPDIPIPEIPDLCNALPIDDIASKLTGALPSQISGLAPDVKDFKVDEVIASVTPDMAALVSSTVDNYRDKLTGLLPEIPDFSEIQSAATNVLNGEIPDLGAIKALAAAAIFDKLPDIAKDALGAVNNLKDQKLNVRIAATDFLKQQKDCVTADLTKVGETASSFGNMLGDVTTSVSELVNTDLRNFSVDASALGDAKSLITGDVLGKAAAALKAGATIAERGEVTSSVLLNTLGRVPSKGIGGSATGPIPGVTTTGTSPTPLLSEKAYKLILDFEVGGGANYYNRFLSRPSWPGVQSGVTIGVGYDLGYYNKSQFAADWKGRIDSGDYARLEKTVGLTKSAAKNAIGSVKDIVIPWSVAEQVYINRTIPVQVARTKRTFPRSIQNGGKSGRLNADAFGALVSLVFNRGGSLSSSSSRLEMRNIHEALLGNIPVTDIYTYISEELSKMKRIWPSVPGLQRRRDAEAALVLAAKP